MSIWRTAAMDVQVAFDDFERAKEQAIASGQEAEIVTVAAEVDIDEALEEATVEQLRDALRREEAAYTNEQVAAIHDCFAAVASGDNATAIALLGRVFEHLAQASAAEQGIHSVAHRRAA